MSLLGEDKHTGGEPASAMGQEDKPGASQRWSRDVRDDQDQDTTGYWNREGQLMALGLLGL